LRRQVRGAHAVVVVAQRHTDIVTVDDRWVVVHLAEGSGRDSDVERQLKRAHEARERLLNLSEKQLGGEELALLAKTYEIESTALFDRTNYEDAWVAAEEAKQLRRKVIDNGDISTKSVLGLIDSIIATTRVNWKRLPEGKSESDARDCLTELDRHAELLRVESFMATYKRAVCMQMLGLAVDEARRSIEARDINTKAYELTRKLLKEHEHNRDLRFTHMALANNIGVTYQSEKKDSDALPFYEEAAMSAAKLTALDNADDKAKDYRAHFLHNIGKVYRRSNLVISDAALRWLSGMPWPGNIRQLKQLIERTILVSGKDVLEVDDFTMPLGMEATDSRRDALPEVGSMTLDDIEKAMIVKALRHHDGNISKVAEALGLSRAALYRRFEKFGIVIRDDAFRV